MTDFIIVGGGPAGCVLANRLSEDPANSVTLLEAGGRDWHPLIHMPAGFARMTKGIASWGWSTVPQKHLNGRVLWYTQAKVLGGGSSINAQIYTRGNARDYDAWEKEEGCTGWGYRDVLPYFKRAENNERYANDYHGGGGPLGEQSQQQRTRAHAAIEHPARLRPSLQRRHDGRLAVHARDQYAGRDQEFSAVEFLSAEDVGHWLVSLTALD